MGNAFPCSFPGILAQWGFGGRKLIERSHQHLSHLRQQGDLFDWQADAGLGFGGFCDAGALSCFLLFGQLLWQAQLPPPLFSVLLYKSRWESHDSWVTALPCLRNTFTPCTMQGTWPGALYSACALSGISRLHLLPLAGKDSFSSHFCLFYTTMVWCLELILSTQSDRRKTSTMHMCYEGVREGAAAPPSVMCLLQCHLLHTM